MILQQCMAFLQNGAPLTPLAPSLALRYSIRAEAKMFLKWIANFLKAINSNASRGQVAAGISCGLLLALIPAGNLLWLLLFIIILLSKANSAMVLIITGIGKLLAPLWAPALDGLGWAILTAPALQEAFSSIADLPIAPLTRFNNTIVMGGLAAGLALWFPVFFLGIWMVELYRRKLAPKIMESKLMKALYKLPLVNLILKALSAASGGAGE